MVQETIQEIAKQLGVGAAELIPHYAKWFFAASIGWILFGCIFILIGFLVFRWLWNWDDKDDYQCRIWAAIIFVVCAIIGFLIIGAHIGDLVAPEGIAYHQLIEDIRGK